MSPEQARGRDIDARSDLDSAGITLFEMLTGKRPIDAAGPAGVLYQHAFGARPVLPRAFDRYQTFLEQVLAVDPDRRPASTQQMLASFDAIHGRASVGHRNRGAGGQPIRLPPRPPGREAAA